MTTNMYGDGDDDPLGGESDLSKIKRKAKGFTSATEGG
jgi:hypothetical protein